MYSLNKYILSNCCVLDPLWALCEDSAQIVVESSCEGEPQTHMDTCSSYQFVSSERIFKQQQWQHSLTFGYFLLWGTNTLEKEKLRRLKKLKLINHLCKWNHMCWFKATRVTGLAHKWSPSVKAQNKIWEISEENSDPHRMKDSRVGQFYALPRYETNMWDSTEWVEVEG